MTMARVDLTAEPDIGHVGRVPPHSLDAEQSVLGAMMLSKTAISEVLEILQPDDFYRHAHTQIATAMRDLFASGEAVDAITVVEELRRKGTLEQAGGAPYIHTLLAGVPTAANAGFYAQIIVEHSTLRRLIDASTRIAQECYDIPPDIDEAINRAGQAIYKVAARRIHSDFRPIRELLAESMEQLEMLASRDSDITGVSTGFRDIDDRLSGLQRQNLIIVAARPAMGKTSFVMNIAHNAALKSNVPVVIFSLEMSQNEIVQRLISSEAHVDSSRLRTGHLSEADWTRVSNAVGKLDTAPLYIDDSASISMMEIRAKCQRLKQQQDLGLVIVDYIQLMQSTRRVENRVQEVSEISRGLKILAKEMDVPVVAVSQLSRQPEQGGGERRPQLSHLRECVTGDTLVCLADGRRVPIERLVGSRPDVLAMDDGGRIVPAASDLVWKVGRQPVFAVRLASGRTIRATAKHRVIGFDGWVRVGTLAAGDRIAIARRLPQPPAPRDWSADRIALLAHLIGDGSYLPGKPLRYTTGSEANSQAVRQAAEREFGARVSRHEGRGNWHQLVLAGNGNRWHPAGVNAWLRSLGVFGQRSAAKRVPEEVFGFSDAGVALFLRHLWATDGTIFVSNSGHGPSVSLATCSRGLADDVAALLLRVGVVARIRSTIQPSGSPLYNVAVSGAADQRTFLTTVGAFGPRVRQAEALKAYLADRPSNTNVDTMPAAAFDRVRQLMRARGMSQRAMAAARGTSYGGTSHFRFEPSRLVLGEYAEILDDVVLRQHASNDLFWDKVVSVDADGEEDVYDLTVPGPASWLADGIISHNSGAIEQDADVVMFVYRDEYYNKESEAKGEAEIIVAKHRNGPVGTERLAFLGQYTKFADLARE